MCIVIYPRQGEYCRKYEENRESIRSCLDIVEYEDIYLC